MRFRFPEYIDCPFISPSRVTPSPWLYLHVERGAAKSTHLGQAIQIVDGYLRVSFRRALGHPALPVRHGSRLQVNLLWRPLAALLSARFTTMPTTSVCCEIERPSAHPTAP